MLSPVRPESLSLPDTRSVDITALMHDVEEVLFGEGFPDAEAAPRGTDREDDDALRGGDQP